MAIRLPSTDRWRLLARMKQRPRLFGGLLPRRTAESAEDLLTGPIRGELLGADQLAERARELARKQRIVVGRRVPKPALLLARLQATHRILDAAHERLLTAFDHGVDVGPAGVWLLDNYHVVREHILEVKESLPRGYYRELPELARGALAGYPRVYEVAISLISHTEGRIDLENVDLFVGAFQEITSLTIGELWAIPAMLRLGLIESVRRTALRTVQRLDEVENADDWAQRIQTANEEGSEALGAILRDFVLAPHALTPMFVSRFLNRLRASAGSFPPLLWLEQWMGEEGLSPEDAAARSTQRTALTQIMMANSITSLRAIARRDWRTFVERQSVIEKALRQDPSGFYPQQTFATRDRCRHVVEGIAKRTRRNEEEVARLAVDLARDAKRADGEDPRVRHVGYYLLDRGLAGLERVTGYRPAAGEATHRWVRRHPNAVFFGGILIGTVVALAALMWLAGPEARSAWLLVTLLALIPANDVAVNTINQIVTTFLPPSILPKLDLQENGIPPEYRTAVVIPTLFGSVRAVLDALDHLEVQYLANRDAHLHFAVLSDFTDAATETREGDAAIVAAAVEGVRALNARYGAGAEDAFYLFHRLRRWNASQGVWMGWERKRGKLAEFNRFLRGGAEGAFSTIVGDVATLRQARYVITLDSDTVLPPNAAPALIGAIAHPLNRAVYDPARGRVVRGYGIVQPRVGVSLPSAHRSTFAKIHSGHPGIDPYTTAVSDVYQDLFDEGSFTGKGIYDVDAFEAATRGRFPENTLLSHDLIEGNFARAGLATDVTLYDDYPSRYLTFTRRKHRWIRGDWQLFQWLTSRVPGPDGLERNRLSMLSRWKIFDNLRRSTVEIAQLALLVAGWTLLPGSPLRWTLLALGAIATPWVIALLIAVLRPPPDKSWRAYYAAVAQDAVTSGQQLALAITFLPHQAWVSADAIIRTLRRLLFSGRKLLEWQTASQTERIVSKATREVWRTMWPAVAMSIAILLIAGTLAASRAGLLDAAERSSGAFSPSAMTRLWLLATTMVPLAFLWAASPAIAQSLSEPAGHRERRLPAAQRKGAMRYALLHWRFFDRLVSANTNWLAPDNYQDDPTVTLALRTSPTNIGLQLLAIVSAYDLGYLTINEMTRRLELAFRSLERMPRFRGHFFNWYDLRDLRVLEPGYISTVDSGNLAGHLIAVRQACLAMPDERAFDARVWRALDTALALAQERLRSLAAREGARPRTPAGIALANAEEELRVARATVGALSRISTRATDSAAGSALKSSSDPGESFSAISASLHRARVAVPRDASTSDRVDSPATEWIDWSIALIEAHRERLEAIGVAADVVHGGHDVPPATLRQLVPQSQEVAELMKRLAVLADRALEYALEMDFRFLFDESRELFSIGYQTATHALDNSYYDLLASEARLASFVAIAKNDVPVDHWFRLGRALTNASGEMALISWSGSMFEYLMPALVMQSFPFTLLNATYESAVRRHIAYGEERSVPWGLSESAYNLRDWHLTYQYRAFGVPDLALKRGLGRDLVIAPYASALAAMVDVSRAVANLNELERRGALGPFGFRDAIDYTRPQPGRRYAVVQCYMAHHVGMSFVALTNVLLAQMWPRRFHADAMVRAAELLLHERVPRRLVLQEPQETHPDEALPDPDMERTAVRMIDTPHTPQPQIALLGYLPYTVMVSHCGGGYSRYEDRAVTRWRADGTRDHTGQFCYVKDISRGRLWSTSHQPVCAPADWYRALLATDRVTFHRSDGEIETRTEIAIVPGDSAEVRRITLTNNGDETREVELTSYGEIVLGPINADRAHPAFSNLFVQTEWHEWCTAITATRRPRSAEEQPLYCVHVVDAGKERLGPVTCETDRSRFLGRGRSTREPAAMERDGALSETTGAVLDPIFALRTRVVLAPRQSASVAFTTLVAATRERAFELAGRYHDPHAAQRALDLTWTATQIELRELNITPADAAVFQEIAGHLLYTNPALRASPEVLRKAIGSQQSLWANGVSGDWPILLATIESAEGLPTLRQLFAAHRYWRRRGMLVDLVIVNAHAHTYFQDLNDQITQAMFTSSDSAVIDRPGGVFLRRRDLMNAEDLLTLSAIARVHIPCDGRALSRILDSARTPDDEELEDRELDPPPLRPSGRSTPPSMSIVQRFRARASSNTPPSVDVTRTRLGHPGNGQRDPNTGVALRAFDNGFGAITANNDYEICVAGDQFPPAPWVNVIANPRGGFVVSERGAGCTWAENSYFFRLTPWHNDPVTDPAGEALYLRDEDSGAMWSATPEPMGDDQPYTVLHGAGTSSFVHEHESITTELTLGIAEDAAVKLSVLKVTNRDKRARSISLTAYAEWSLGALREHTQHHVRTTFDRSRAAIFARNPYDPQFAGWVAFLSMSETATSHTGDRREFVGRNGALRQPAALLNRTLSGTTGVGLDPCGALQCVLELAPGETREIAVLLGAAPSDEEARKALDTYRNVAHAKAAIAHTIDQWRSRLSVITVRTPEPSFDVMVNRWTLYQALACRMWARSALYQSSGAYGFRDQLQDVMAFVYAEPAIARRHILRAAARQFIEGDVQHWWHPQSGRGVRTRISDDLAWLPYVVDHYVRVTGDSSVLDEYVPFLVMRPLAPDEHELYDLPAVTDEHGSVYEHSLRALRRACTVGERGLPLMGSGDWNDGMNRVGIHGKGESVWLAWFLASTLGAFAKYAEARGDSEVAREFRTRADAYAAAVEATSWDGKWYRRAYFDDGTPLGSVDNAECRIDSIAQSWSVISGRGEPERQARAMESLEEHLVREDARLIVLLTPPFDRTPNDPGYIKGYLPGVRENGAQYTHAALWAVLATTLRGDGDRAFELYQMINPLTRTATPDGVATYKAEPYVVAADVYTAEGQLGRGGWTWYTGSASWMYRVAVEAMLGVIKEGDRLTIDPCIPSAWRDFAITYRHGKSIYAITVRNPDGVSRGVVRVETDGRAIPGGAVTLVDDGLRHDVIVTMGLTGAEPNAPTAGAGDGAADYAERTPHEL